MNLFIVFCGVPKSGKSILIKSIIKKYSRRYSYGIVICPYQSIEDYNYIENKYIHTDPDIINKLKQKQIKTKKKRRAFLIIDDCIGIFNSGSSKLFIDLYTTYRHYNIDLFISIQYIRQSRSRILLNCASTFIMFHISNQESIKSIYESYGGRFENLKKFKDYLNECFFDNEEKIKKYFYLEYNLTEDNFILHSPVEMTKEFKLIY